VRECRSAPRWDGLMLVSLKAGRRADTLDSLMVVCLAVDWEPK
jgi:hypothetical protein